MNRRGGHLPWPAAIVRFADAVLMELNDEWTEARRYMGIKVLAKIGASPDMSADVNAIESNQRMTSGTDHHGAVSYTMITDVALVATP